MVSPRRWQAIQKLSPFSDTLCEVVYGILILHQTNHFDRFAVGMDTNCIVTNTLFLPACVSVHPFALANFCLWFTESAHLMYANPNSIHLLTLDLHCWRANHSEAEGKQWGFSVLIFGRCGLMSSGLEVIATSTETEVNLY